MTNKPPIFIGGAGRSGTTLLRVILDSHSQIACGPELKITPLIASYWYDFQTKYSPFLKEYLINEKDINLLFSNMITSLLEKYRSSQNKNRIAEKSPNNIKIFYHLSHIFPDSPLIHIVRDGRDVIASLLTMDWKNPDGQPIAYTNDPIEVAKYWKDAVQTGLKFAKQSNLDNHFLLKYEELVTSPEDILKKLFSFLNEPWEENVLKFHEKHRNLANESSASQVNKKLYTSSIGRWKNDLTVDQKSVIKPIINDTLLELGYIKDINW